MRAALIGCGKIAHWHRSALVRAGVDLVAAVDRDPQKAALAAAGAPGCRPYTDVGEMLREAQPDVVHVLTPPSTHTALAIQAARAGAHVLVEKPVALSIEDADAMLAAAAEHGVQVISTHNYLWKPSILKARRLVDSGQIGDVVYVDAFYGLYGEAAESGAGHWSAGLPGGPFTNYLPHLVYLQDVFLGGIQEVSGVSVGRDPASSEVAEVTVLLQGVGGPGVMAVSTRTQPYAKYVRIHGTKGIVHADLVGEVTTINRARRVPRLLSKALFNVELVPQLTAGTAANTARVATGAMPNMPDLHTFVAELYAALEAGRPVPAGATGRDGRTVTEVLEQVWARMPEHQPAKGQEPAAAPAAAPRTAVERRVATTGVAGKVLVTGAGGYLGRNLVAALHRCGADVRALVRDPGRVPAGLSAQAEVVFGNIVDETAVARAMEDVELVVHCAAVTTNNVPWRVHQETNVEGTRVVKDAARAAGARRLVHISSVIVYGTTPQSNGDGTVSESAPYPEQLDRWAYYLRSKVAAEQVLREDPAGAPDGLEVAVVRPGILYGPGAAGPVTKGLVQLGSVRLTLGRGRNALPLAYIDNVVDGILLALTSPAAAGASYNLVDDPQPRAREAAARADAVVDGGVRFVGLPPAPLKALAGRLEARAAEAGADQPPKLSRFQIASATRDVRYSTRRARADLGWAPEVGLDEGLRRALTDA